MLVGPALFRRMCEARKLLSLDNERAGSVADVAHEVGISPFHFIRVFEKLFGVTPHHFRTSARLERARCLLARGEHSVTEVCFEVGFSSVGSFSDLFARRVGEAPSLYARRVRALSVVPEQLSRELWPGCLSLMTRLPAGAFCHRAQG
jgi:AraC-like DNA-binding protein